ncbi:hypothetical protein MHY_02120 [Megamonas hypermegale ART12/1]|nr:hypothetical protein MHY_02120 [Megamonas hypermegale ART12/1]
MRFSTDISAYLLKYIVKKYNIDLIHANSAAAGITAMKYKQRYNKNMPVVFTVHGKFGDLKKENILKDCDKLIYVSQFVKDDSIKKDLGKIMLVLYTQALICKNLIKLKRCTNNKR